MNEYHLVTDLNYGTVEFWNFLFNALTAVGTVGAVWVALWAILRKPKRFAIRKVQLSSTVEMGEDFKPKNRTDYLVATLENFLDVTMQVAEISLQPEHKLIPENNGLMSGYIMPVNAVIPPYSIYDIRVALTTGQDKPGTYSKADYIEVSVTTNFGKKEVEFPAEWKERLVGIMERNLTKDGCEKMPS